MPFSVYQEFFISYGKLWGNKETKFSLEKPFENVPENFFFLSNNYAYVAW